MSKTERLAQVVEGTGLGSLIRRLGAWTGVLVFNYHRIGPVDSSYDAGIWDASPSVFEQQVRFLKKEFDVIGPDDLETAVRARRGRSVLLTFDDGYRDNFAAAFPILKRHGVRATFFVTTGFLDSGDIAWWDEVAWIVHASGRSELRLNPWLDRLLSLHPSARRATTMVLIDMCRNLSGESQRSFLDFLAGAAGTGRHRPGEDFWMTWEQVRQMRAAGMHLGGHTVSHPLLARLPAAEQHRQIVGCRDRIEAELGEPMRYFSYPYGSEGSFDESTVRILAASGVELAFSFYGGYQRATDWNPYDVRRCCVGMTVSPRRFALMSTVPQVFSRPQPDASAGESAG